MRRVILWVLTIGGLIGLLTAFGFELKQQTRSVTKDSIVIDTTLRVGEPDVWLEWEDGPNGRKSDLHIVRWSFVILVASVFALCSAVLLKWRLPRASSA